MKNNKGFTVVEGLLILVIFGTLGFIGWYVLSVRNKTNDQLGAAASVSNLAASQIKKTKPGSTVQTGANSQAGATSNLANSSTPTYASGGYLTISQWNNKIPVDDSVTGLYYTLAKNGVASFRDKALDDVSSGCTSNSVDVAGGTADWHVANELGTQDGSTFVDAYNSALSYKNQNSRGVAVHIGTYYFVVPGYAGASCVTDASSQSKEADAVMSIVKAVNKMVSE